MLTSDTTATINTRRSHIIEAAIRVLARDGIAETTTRKIATEANVNQAMLRYYFGSKDELLFAVLKTMMQLTREIVLSVTNPQATLRETIRNSLTAFWLHVEAEPELQIIQYELTLYALRHPTSAWLAKEQYDGYCSVVETLFREASDATQHAETQSFAALARFVIGGLDGLILQYISDRNGNRARQDLTRLIDTVIGLTDGFMYSAGD